MTNHLELVDNALADLEVARTFIDAADKYFDELNDWLNPKVFTPNRALHAEVNKGSLLVGEADVRIGRAEDRLRKLFAAMPAGRPAPAPSSAFDAAWQTYVDAFNAANAFYLLNFPGDGGDFTEFEPAFDAYAIATFNAATAVLAIPASSAAEMSKKMTVIEQQEATTWDSQTQGPILQQLAVDAIAVAGEAA